jgi:hypothetical protein
MRIAIVGNAPLTETDMDEINTFDKVVRFNYLNNARPDDKMTDVVYRYKDQCAGFVGNLAYISKSQCIHYLNQDCTALMKELSGDIPYITYHKHIQDAARWKHMIHIPHPTTGYITVLYMSSMYTKDDIHLFGFNWSTAELLKFHLNISDERANILSLPLTVHESLPGYHHTFIH